MTGETLIYIGAALPLLWGLAHLFPTNSVVLGFGDISRDNKHIIAMEWIIEGVSLIFVGALLFLATAIDPKNKVSIAVYISSSCFLIVMAVVSLFTGFRVNFLPFRLCPVIFTSSAILIIWGWMTLN